MFCRGVPRLSQGRPLVANPVEQRGDSIGSNCPDRVQVWLVPGQPLIQWLIQWHVADPLGQQAALVTGLLVRSDGSRCAEDQEAAEPYLGDRG